MEKTSFSDRKHKKIKKKSRAHLEKNDESLTETLFASIFGAIVGFAVFLLSALIMSAICLKIKNPHVLLPTLSAVCVIISSLMCGFAATRKNGRQNALICGIFSGSIFALLLKLLLLLSAMILKGKAAPFLSLFLIIIPILAIVGAFAANLKRRTRKRRK